MITACAAAFSVLGLTGVVALAVVPGASADGDPASDVLLVDSVFYPYEVAVSPALTAALNTTVARADAAGFPIKLAMIESPIDLGAIPQLFGKPEEYAKYLDVEISYNSVAKLLVVMPQGFGTFASGPVSALDGIHIDAAARSNGLAEAAILAIAELAKRSGHSITLPSAIPGLNGSGAQRRRSGGGSGSAVALAAAVVIVALAAAGTFLIWERRRATVGSPLAPDDEEEKSAS